MRRYKKLPSTVFGHILTENVNLFALSKFPLISFLEYLGIVEKSPKRSENLTPSPASIVMSWAGHFFKIG